MKYFQIYKNKNYNPSPIIKEWSKDIDIKNICLERAHLLPKRKLFNVEPNKDLVWTAIISNPFFLINEDFIEIVKKYVPGLIKKDYVLLDYENRNTSTYHLPILEEVACISNKENLKKGIDKNIILDKKIVKDRILFKVYGLNNNDIIIRMDLVESIMRRGAIGIALKEIIVE